MSFSDETPGMEYTIRVKGCLNGPDWSSWFGDMVLSVDEDRGETVINGMILDSAELYGMISRLRNLGLTLISIESSKPNPF